MDRLFLDANVLFTATHRPQGKAGFPLQTAALPSPPWRLLSSAYAIEEARRNLQNKLPDSLPEVEHGLRASAAEGELKGLHAAPGSVMMVRSGCHSIAGPQDPPRCGRRLRKQDRAFICGGPARTYGHKLPLPTDSYLASLLPTSCQAVARRHHNILRGRGAANELKPLLDVLEAGKLLAGSAVARRLFQ